MEIHEKTNPKTGGLQIGNDNRLMNAFELLDGLQFDEDATGDDEIDPLAGDPIVSIHHFNRFFTFERNMPSIELEVQSRPVDAFEEPRSQGSVHCESGIDNFCDDRFGISVKGRGLNDHRFTAVS